MTTYHRLLGVLSASLLLASMGCLAASGEAPEDISTQTATQGLSKGSDVDSEEASKAASVSRRRGQIDSLVQLGTFEKLNRGEYAGLYPARWVGGGSSFGVGTFDGLNGEMIVLDGVIYHALADGQVTVAQPHDTTPFATVTQFRTEQSYKSRDPLTGYPAVQAYLNGLLPNQEQMLAIKIHGTFSSLKLRAPQKQAEPYVVLTEALKTQAIFTPSNIRGTMVGFRLPTYLGTTVTAGYHFHFVSDDHRTAGHVLDVNTASVKVDVSTLERFDMTAEPADFD